MRIGPRRGVSSLAAVGVQGSGPGLATGLAWQWLAQDRPRSGSHGPVPSRHLRHPSALLGSGSQALRGRRCLGEPCDGGQFLGVPGGGCGLSRASVSRGFPFPRSTESPRVRAGGTARLPRAPTPLPAPAKHRRRRLRASPCPRVGVAPSSCGACPRPGCHRPCPALAWPRRAAAPAPLPRAGVGAGAGAGAGPGRRALCPARCGPGPSRRAEVGPGLPPRGTAAMPARRRAGPSCSRHWPAATGRRSRGALKPGSAAGRGKQPAEEAPPEPEPEPEPCMPQR